MRFSIIVMVSVLLISFNAGIFKNRPALNKHQILDDMLLKAGLKKDINKKYVLTVVDNTYTLQITNKE